MITLSLCMIVKNEETTLPRLLSEVCDVFDEIIIADTGSTDATKSQAMKFTDKIFDFKWCDDFSAARNFSFSKAKSEYIMWLDADDILKKDNVKKLISLKQSLSPETDVVMMKYHAAFDENGNPSFSYFRERIVKREKGFMWGGVVHEAITPSGKIVYSDVEIYHAKPADKHYTKRNLNIYEKKLGKGESLDAREKFYYARELYYHKSFTRAIDVFLEFLNLPEAWSENKISACIHLADCYNAINKKDLAYDSLLWSLRYDIRAEALCYLGKTDLEAGNINKAIFWYKCALLCKKNEKSGGFINPDCYDFIPNIQLSVCYDRIGNIKKAVFHNNKAGKIKPADKSFLHNRDYFNRILSKCK